MKYLVIVESPSKAKTIQKYLGKNYTVQASMGHVRDLPKSKLGIDVEGDFQPQYLTIRGKAELINKLKKEVKNSDKVFLATDPDREGEAISWHLATALDIPEKNTARVVFNEITKDAVKNAIKNPRDIDIDLVDAQQARRVLDRIVGYKISPLLWRKIKKGLSAGRVQSVVLKLICDREKEIEAFEPKEFWNITAKLGHKKSRGVFKAKFYGDTKRKITLGNEKEANAVLEAVKDKPYTVADIKKVQKKRVPTPPFITSTMQQEATRKLGFTSLKTMSVAQQLYEGIEIKGAGAVGLITYMRTDSTRIADEAKQAARAYIAENFGNEYVPAKPREYSNKKNAQDAHEAIRPSVVSYSPDKIKTSLTNDQYKLYKLIWERFMASQMKEAEVENTTVSVAVDKYIFKATGTTVLFDGFMVLYTEGKDTEDEEKEQKLPQLEVGEELSFRDIESKQNFTKPPARYTEATIIRAMEEMGIGRPSTYAPTISTVTARHYVEKEKKMLVPTELGNIVNDLMAENFKDIVDAGFTADMEQKLDKVEQGETRWVDVVRDFYGPFEKTLEVADKNIEHVEIKPEETDIPCEKCGRNMVIREGRFGKFLACPGYPKCRNAKPIRVELGVKCPKCGGEILERKTKKGTKYYSCEKYPECDFTTWDLPTNEKCPVCGDMLLQKSINRRITKVKACLNESCGFNEKKKKKEE